MSRLGGHQSKRMRCCLLTFIPTRNSKAGMQLSLWVLSDPTSRSRLRSALRYSAACRRLAGRVSVRIIDSMTGGHTPFPRILIWSRRVPWGSL